jgi:hypothetical protein
MLSYRNFFSDAEDRLSTPAFCDHFGRHIETYWLSLPLDTWLVLVDKILVSVSDNYDIRRLPVSGKAATSVREDLTDNNTC